MMSLRAHVGNAEDHGLRDLALDGEVVLLGILSLQMRIEFAEQQNRTEGGPVHATFGAGWIRTRSGRSLVVDARERIRRERADSRIAGLRHEGQIKVGRVQGRATAEGRLGAELLQNQLFHRIVKNAEAGANAGFSRTAK